MEFSRPEYWSGQSFPSPGDLPNPGIEPRTPTLQVASLPAEPQGKPKNTGVGSLSLLQEIFITRNRTGVSCIAGRFFTNWAMREAQVQVKVAQSCLTLCDSMEYSPWNSPGQNTGVGSLSLLQGIFPTQGSYPGLPHCRWLLYQLSHKGSLGQTIPHCCDAVLRMVGCAAASLASPL